MANHRQELPTFMGTSRPTYPSPSFGLPIATSTDTGFLGKIQPVDLPSGSLDLYQASSSGRRQETTPATLDQLIQLTYPERSHHKFFHTNTTYRSQK